MSFVWLRRWAPLLLPAAEAAWLTPWILVVSGASYGGGGVILDPVPVLGLLVGGYLLAGAAGGRTPLSRARLAIVLAAVLLGLWAVWATHYRGDFPAGHPGWIWRLLRAAHDAFPVVPPSVLGALAAPLLIWRGLTLGGREFSPFTAEHAFRRGVAWSAAFAFLFAAFPRSEAFTLARPVAAGYLLGFAFLSLVLVAVARLLGIWEEAQGRDPRALAFNRPWFGIALAVAAAVVLVGGAVGNLAGMDVAPYLVPVLRALAPLAEVVFLVLFYAASLVARLLLFVLSRLPWRDAPPTPLEPLPDVLRAMRDLQVSPEVVSGARWGMVVLTVLVLVFVFLVVTVRARRRPAAGDDEERESVWEADRLRRWLRRLRRRDARPRAPRDDLTGAPGAVAVRVIYRRLLRAAAAGGRARRPEQTAREFGVAIEPAVAEAADALHALTLLYEGVRYGARRPTPPEVEAAGGQLRRLQAALRPRKGTAGGPRVVGG